VLGTRHPCHDRHKHMTYHVAKEFEG
jgi:hypothetical protein